MRATFGFFGRLAAAIALVDVACALVFWAFAPRWLLLDPPLADHMGAVAWTLTAFAFVGQMIVLGVLTMQHRRLLMSLPHVALGDDLLRLFALPSRLAYARVALAVVIGIVMFVLRLNGVDSYTQATLVILYITLVTTATLPLYVMARSVVAHMMELVPADASRDAVALLRRQGRSLRVERRFLVALAAPVALVAVGALLLVYAHARNAHDVASRADAVGFASGVLDRVDGRDDGRVEAIAAARAFGMSIERQSADGDAVTVTLEDGPVTMHYLGAGPGSAAVLWLAIAALGVALAAFIGQRLGARLSSDVTLATREIEATGVVDVLRGSRVFRSATFQSVRALASSIEELGGVFREFAAAQERAIVARAAAERMRALLLATMSHDLKGPLNAILGFATLLGRGELTDGQRENVVIIQQRGRELLYLIETVLDAARFEAGPIELSRHEAPTQDVVMAASLDAQELLQGTGRDVHVQAKDDLPMLEIDSARVVQALVSLVHAASRMSQSGPILLRAQRGRAGSLEVFVEAETAALSPEESAQIAEVDVTASVRLAGRRPMSLALGLSIARAILEAHGGSLTVAADASMPLRLVAILPSATADKTMKTAPPVM